MIKLFVSFMMGAICYVLVENFILDKHIDKDIKTLQLQNDSLVKANIKLDSLENKFLGELNNANYEILKLESQDNALETQVNYYNREIKVIKNKYEKAKHFADSYGSDDIKRYFSNLR